MEQNQLSHYGDCIATYSGKGTLTLLDNQTAQCSFEVGQLKTGNVILICNFSPSPHIFFIHSAKFFEGVTDKGFRISTAGQIIAMNDLTNDANDLSSYRLAFFVSEITVQLIVGKPVRNVRFGVTNLVLDKPLSVTLQEYAIPHCQDKNRPTLRVNSAIRQMDVHHDR